jgi:hypothetical protein
MTERPRLRKRLLETDPASAARAPGEIDIAAYATDRVKPIVEKIGARGGSLGAYECGVYQALAPWLRSRWGA